MDPAVDKPLASIIVPCRNHSEELARCLQSLDRQEVNFVYETVVVDSASDPRVALVARGFPRVRVVRGDQDLLAGPARNVGVRRSYGEYIAFIDADCQADPGWLASAVSGLDHGVEMVGGPVLDARPWHPVAVTDNLLQFADFLPGRRDGPARYFPGCNTAVRRAAFLAVGGFSEGELIAGEDTSFCDQVLDRWPRGIRFVQGMRVRHDGRARLVEFLRHQASFGYVRGALELHLSPTYQRWGSRGIFMPAVVVKRLSYIVQRNVRWDLLRTPRLALLLPLIIAGLVAWAGGFRRGCRDAHHRPEAESVSADGGRNETWS